MAAAEAGCHGLLTNDFVLILAREADGTMSDGTAFMVWTHFIGAVIRSKGLPLKADAGAFDFPKVKLDEEGFPVDRDGERLKVVKEFDPETGELVAAHRDGEVACVTDDYDEADWLEHVRCQAADWADACAVAADLIRTEGRGAPQAGDPSKECDAAEESGASLKNRFDWLIDEVFVPARAIGQALAPIKDNPDGAAASFISCKVRLRLEPGLSALAKSWTRCRRTWRTKSARSPISGIARMA